MSPRTPRCFAGWVLTDIFYQSGHLSRSVIRFAVLIPPFVDLVFQPLLSRRYGRRSCWEMQKQESIIALGFSRGLTISEGAA